MRQRLRSAEAKIARFQKMETLGELTVGAAHDLNNLLTPIMNALEIVHLREHDDTELRNLTDGALQAAMTARNLVRRLLAVARDQEIEVATTDVAPVIAATVDLLRHLLPPSIAINLGELPTAIVEIDPNQLELALLNLAINARDAMPDGGTLTIDCCNVSIDNDHASLQPGHYLRLRMIDDGCGMDAETAKNAVEPFFTTKSQGRGTGLGLSMTQRLAVQAGGLLEIETAPGIGTTITMMLQLVAAVPNGDASNCG